MNTINAQTIYNAFVTDVLNDHTASALFNANEGGAFAYWCKNMSPVIDVSRNEENSYYITILNDIKHAIKRGM